MSTAQQHLLGHIVSDESPESKRRTSCVPVQIDFNDVSYTVNHQTKEEKTILHNVSCSMTSGTFTALMGPSGAGKTTFLNILLQNAAHFQEGEVLANGHSITHDFSKMCNYVPQEDVMLTALTPREALGFMARLRIGGPNVTSDDRHRKIDEVLDALGIQECADTSVGTVEDKGISGGQRKRLSIAMELLDDPSVLVLDEPTSGLDSKAAGDVVKILEQLAVGTALTGGRLVLATIHQPSWALLERFHNLLLVQKGHMVYDGSVEEFPVYFEANSCLMPKNANPADHVMEVIQEEGVDWTALWNAHKPQHTPCRQTDQEPWVNQEFAVGPVDQFRTLLSRNCLDFMKDKAQFAQLTGGKIFIGIMVGLCWINASRPAKCGDLTDKIFTVTGALFMVVNNCLMDDLFATVLSFPSIKAILMREYKNGVYGIMPWFSAFWFSRLISQVLYALLLMIPVYFLVGLRLDLSGTKFFVACLCLALCSITGTTLGLAVGAASKDVNGALGFVMPTLVPMMLFSGYVIPFAEIPIAFKWIYWISPFQYAFNILRINQFHDLDFQDDICKSTGKPGGKVPFCHGNEYLETLHYDLSPGDFLHRSFLLLGGLAAFVFMMALLVVRTKVQKKSG
eukprot:TRINITY_DN20337_c0_g1_i3.p1 TRINITY_DN20337_c0_g1~~TRINITY_DN20337_c0_g1_i3.p1  ORF type:complete len:624 (+),score=168.26 TRINITY_DN20337_c0_g1_i3:200-2071(+)